MSDTQMRKMPDQVPPALRRFDDPWGITWRVNNILRRFSIRWISRFISGLAKGPTHERPIFIIGIPRSGTTFLFHLLRESTELVALQREGHDIWRLFHHPRYSSWDSDHVGKSEVRRGERRVINAIFYALAGSRRFIEKTADNSVRFEYIKELFPDATFVVMKRNPCDVINSYINGWRHPEGRFRSYFVPDRLSIPGYDHKHQWCSTLIRDWRKFSDQPIAEIAFEQWRQYVETVAAARSSTPAHQWVECHLENLLDDPTGETSRIYSVLGIQDESSLQSQLKDLLKNPVNAMTPPGDEKWRSQNRDEVESLLPRIGAYAPSLGYSVDPVTGVMALIQETHDGGSIEVEGDR